MKKIIGIIVMMLVMLSIAYADKCNGEENNCDLRVNYQFVVAVADDAPASDVVLANDITNALKYYEEEQDNVTIIVAREIGPTQLFSEVDDLDHTEFTILVYRGDIIVVEGAMVAKEEQLYEDIVDYLEANDHLKKFIDSDEIANQNDLLSLFGATDCVVDSDCGENTLESYCSNDGRACNRQESHKCVSGMCSSGGSSGCSAPCEYGCSDGMCLEEPTDVDEKYYFQEGRNDLNFYEQLRDVKEKLTSDDISGLADGKFRAKSLVGYTQEVNAASDAEVVYDIYSEMSADPEIYLKFADKGDVIEYYLRFKTAALSDVDDDRLEDLEDNKIFILGHEYRIVKALKLGDDVKLTLMRAPVQDTLEVGQTKVYTINGVDYDTTLMVVSGSGSENLITKIIINDEVSKTLKAGESYKLVDGTPVEIVDIGTHNSGNISNYYVDLRVGGVDATLEVGQTTTVITSGGKEYETTVMVVAKESPDAASKFIINDEVTDSLSKNDIYTLKDGTNLGIIEVIPTKSGDIIHNLVEFQLGATKIVLDGSDNSVDINGEASVADAAAYIDTVATTDGDFGIDTIKVEFHPSIDDLYVDVGGVLSDTSALEKYEYREFLEAFDIDYGFEGAKGYDTEDVEFAWGDSDTLYMEFANKDDINYKFPLFHFENGTGPLPGDERHKLSFAEGDIVCKREFFITEDNANKRSIVWQMNDVRNMSGMVEVRVSDIGTGQDYYLPVYNGRVEFDDYTASVVGDCIQLEDTVIGKTSGKASVWTKYGAEITFGGCSDDPNESCQSPDIAVTEPAEADTGARNTFGFDLYWRGSLGVIEQHNDGIEGPKLLNHDMQEIKTGYTDYGTWVILDYSGEQNEVDLLIPDMETSFEVYFRAGDEVDVPQFCADTDGGRNIFEKGVVSAYNFPNPVEDSCCINCMTAPTMGGLSMREYYCEANKGTFDIVQCKYGCQDAVCVSEPTPITVYDDLDSCSDDGKRVEYNKRLGGSGSMPKYRCVDSRKSQEYWCGNDTVEMQVNDCEYGCFNGMCQTDEEVLTIQMELEEGWNLLPIGEGMDFGDESELGDVMEAAYVYDPKAKEYQDLYESDDVLEWLIEENGWTSVWVYVSEDVDFTIEMDLEQVTEALKEKDIHFYEGWNFFVLLPHMQEGYEDGFLRAFSDKDGNLFIQDDKVFTYDADGHYDWNQYSADWEYVYTETIVENMQPEWIGMPIVMKYTEEFEPFFSEIDIPEFPDI